MITISRASTAEHFKTIETFGREILPEIYAPYFPVEWANYLFNSGHTMSALEAQAAKGYRHYRVEVGTVLAGYFALHLRADGTMILSHLYLGPGRRGMGLGQMIMDFVHREAAESKAKGIELVVLRKNVGAVRFYQRHGYEIAKEIMTPIGPGAELEDYLMRREVSSGN